MTELNRKAIASGGARTSRPVASRHPQEGRGIGAEPAPSDLDHLPDADWRLERAIELDRIDSQRIAERFGHPAVGTEYGLDRVITAAGRWE